MPSGGVENRSEQLALVAGLLHDRGTDPRLGELLAAVEGSELLADPAAPAAVNVASCSGASTTGSSGCRGSWSRRWPAPPRWRRRPGPPRAAPPTSRDSGPGSSGSSPSSARKPSAWGTRTSRYDALLEDYEPGLRSAVGGPAVRRAPAASWCRCSAASPARRAGRTRRCCAATSRATASAVSARRVAAAVGFDFGRGRMDLGVHPSLHRASGRATAGSPCASTSATSPAGCSPSSTRSGHGLYEQGLDPEHYGTPLGEAASVGMDEAQARFWENRVGRDRRFWEHFYPQRARALPREPGRRPAGRVPFRGQPGGALADPGPGRRGDLQPARHDPLRARARAGLGRARRGRSARGLGRRLPAPLWAWRRGTTPKAACRTGTGPTG